MKIKIGFFGVGNMGYAIIRSAVESGYIEANRIGVYDILAQNAQRAAGLGVVVYDCARKLAADCEYIFLCAKPQDFAELIAGIKQAADKETVVVSVGAGIDYDFLSDSFGFAPKTVLCMPNAPLMIGAGAAALAKAGGISHEQYKFVEGVFSSGGTAVLIDKDKMNEIIAINASSPAFIYLFAKGFAEYAQDAGLDARDSMKLFCAALRGSAAMLESSDKTIDELITMVASKGGTTEAGLRVFNEKGLTETVKSACNACLDRARGMRD
ncbi:MAG: NAD(P)-binding domain-containing protein [Oscillospiraceae bacterium]|nr:NAD(P)-binding domain-containing protein [Oscillospiraceae bacterium]